MEQEIVEQVKTVSELQHEVAVLTIARDNLSKLFSEAKSHHHSDIALISEKLNEIADEKSFCSEYDDFVEELNEKLHINLKPRTKEYEVTIRVTRTQTQDITVVVECAYEEDAAEQAFELDWESEVRDYDWEDEDQSEEVQDVRVLER
jgi:hypothetical protein